MITMWTRLQPAYAANMWNEALNKRLGTQVLDLICPVITLLRDQLHEPSAGYNALVGFCDFHRELSMDMCLVVPFASRAGANFCIIELVAFNNTR